MNKGNTPDFEGSPLQLLQAKVDYHRQQIKQHSDQIKQTKALIDQLKTTLASAENLVSHPNVLKREPVSKEGKYATVEVAAPRDFSVTFWKPQVEEHLKTVGILQKTDEILSALFPNNDYNAEEKRKAIGAISSSLFALVQAKKVKKQESSGRGYAYQIVVEGATDALGLGSLLRAHLDRIGK